MSAAASGWEPVAEESDDVVTAAVATAMHNLLDAPGAPPGNGDPLPPLWHWLAFLPRNPQREIGEDGHPRRGGFMPPAQGRRMFAGGRCEFTGALPVGAPIRRRSIVTGVEEKSGRSGRLVFVTVDHQLGGLDQVAVRETQDVVYRPPVPAATGSAPPAAPVPDDEAWAWELALATDPTLLFRFSALTYNAHRIHYDRRYATEEEGYPGLVVHGPLQAMVAAELCRRNLPERKLRSFRFRAVRPAFDGPPLRAVGRLEDDGENVTLAVIDHEGHKTVEATGQLQLEPSPA